LAYVTVHTLDGDPRDLLSRKEQHFDPIVRRIAPHYGCIASVTTQTDTGLMIVNTWESADRVPAFTAHPEARPPATPPNCRSRPRSSATSRPASTCSSLSNTAARSGRKGSAHDHLCHRPEHRLRRCRRRGQVLVRGTRPPGQPWRRRRARRD